MRYKIITSILLIILVYLNSSNASVPSYCTDRRVIIAYVNGMLVSAEDAIRNLEYLKGKIILKSSENLKEFFLKNYFSGYFSTLLYNRYHSPDRDIIEAYIQLTKEAGMSYKEARQVLFLWYFGILGIAVRNNPLAKLIANLYAVRLLYIYKTQPSLLNNNYIEHKKIIQDWLNKGYPIIFISHSQGNLFVNAYKDNGWFTTNISDSLQPIIRVIHLATPTTKTTFKDDRSIYYTVQEDLVIAKLVKSLVNVGLDINILPPNVELGCGNMFSCMNLLDDTTLHGFVEVYLNKTYPIQKPFYNMVLDNINEFTKDIITEWYENIIGDTSNPFYEFNKLALGGKCPICGIDPLNISDRHIDPPRFEKLTCSSPIYASGGYQVTTLIVDVSDLPKNTILHSEFEPYYIPDSICISHPPGVEKVKEIRIGGRVGTPNLPLNSYFEVNTSYTNLNPINSKVIIIIVGEEPFTAWDFSLSCY